VIAVIGEQHPQHCHVVLIFKVFVFAEWKLLDPSRDR
jgi:hypothetical protein